jgi:RING-like zinc finger
MHPCLSFILLYSVIIGFFGGFQSLSDVFANQLASCSYHFIDLLRATLFTNNMMVHIWFVLYVSQEILGEAALNPFFNNLGLSLQLGLSYIIMILLLVPLFVLTSFISTLHSCDSLSNSFWIKSFYWLTVGILIFPPFVALLYALCTCGGIFKELLKIWYNIIQEWRIDRSFIKQIYKGEFDRDLYINYCKIMQTYNITRFGLIDAFFLIKYCQRYLSDDVIEYFKLNPRKCRICLNSFSHGEKVILTRECTHIFHSDCISAQILCFLNCPDCSRNVREDLKSQVICDMESRRSLTMNMVGYFGNIPPNSETMSKDVGEVLIIDRPRLLRIEEYYYLNEMVN